MSAATDWKRASPRMRPPRRTSATPVASSSRVGERHVVAEGAARAPPEHPRDRDRDEREAQVDPRPGAQPRGLEAHGGVAVGERHRELASGPRRRARPRRARSTRDERRRRSRTPRRLDRRLAPANVPVHRVEDALRELRGVVLARRRVERAQVSVHEQRRAERDEGHRRHRPPRASRCRTRAVPARARIRGARLPRETRRPARAPSRAPPTRASSRTPAARRRSPSSSRAARAPPGCRGRSVAGRSGATSVAAPTTSVADEIDGDEARTACRRARCTSRGSTRDAPDRERRGAAAARVAPTRTVAVTTTHGRCREPPPEQRGRLRRRRRSASSSSSRGAKTDDEQPLRRPRRRAGSRRAARRAGEPRVHAAPPLVRWLRARRRPRPARGP